MITSKDNAKFKLWLKLTQKKVRTREHLFLVEGQHLVEEAFAAGVLKEVILRENTNINIDVQKYYLPEVLFNKLSSTITSAGIVGVCKIIEIPLINYNRILIVDNVSDPGNLGTLIRSALAFSFDGIILSYETVDIYNEKVIRATQGAIFKLPIVRKDLLLEIKILKEKRVRTFATAFNQNSKIIHEVENVDQMAFIVGNEGAGVRKELIELCDDSVIIPMSDSVESLNVGVAGSILMYEFKK